MANILGNDLGIAVGTGFPMMANMAFNAIQDNANWMAMRQAQQVAERRQREAERTAMTQQMHMQRMADAYNSPSAQMARLREAGLNPMIAFSNGVNGNLSTGVPSVVSPQSMGVPSMSSSSNDLLSAFSTLGDVFNKKRELDILADNSQFANAKTDAETKGILKTNSFMDAVEHDRHAEANSRILTNEAQRVLYFAQKDKLIEDALQAKNELIENRRQFEINMKFLKKQESNKIKLRGYEMQFEAALKAKERLANEKLSAATNSTWLSATLLNSDWMKYKYYKDNGGNLHDAALIGGLSGRFGSLSAPVVGSGMIDERVNNAYDRYNQTQQTADDARSGNKSKYKNAKDKLGRVSYSNSTGTNR